LSVFLPVVSETNDAFTSYQIRNPTFIETI